MFSAKKNNISPSNTALKQQQKSSFIQPEMKVIKPDAKKDKAEKENAKESVKDVSSVENIENKTFFAPKNKNPKDVKENDEVLKKVAKESTENKNEKVNKEATSKAGDNGAKALITPTALPNINANTNTATPTVNSSAKNTSKLVETVEKGNQEEGKKEKEVVEETATSDKKIPKAPTKPEDDPDFQAQIAITEKAKEEKSQHPNPETKVTEQQAAGHASSATQAAKNDQQAHATSMDATSEQEKEREPFTPESFKKLLEKNLTDLEKQLPQNSEEAQEFREEKPIEGIKENISGQVTSESDALAGPMKNEADKPAPASGAPTIEAQPLPVADPGLAPKPLNAKAAIPKPKTNQEISMEKESQSLDNKMAENNVTDEQLAKSNEPKFTGALDQKNQAQVEAKLAPVNYRKKEEAQLGAAQNTAATASQEGLDQMQGAKQLSENNVLANQTTNKTSDKTEQEKIFGEFKAIYEETKQTVTDSLEKLSEDVDKKFSEEAESAQKTFEKNVEDGLGDIYGWTVIDDWIFGEDTEAIDKLFRVEKSKFVSKMNSVLDDISIIIADGLNAALDAIADGKRKSKEKFDSLDESQKKLGEEAFNDFNDQYAELEDTVYEKQDELASDLAQSYKENVDSLQAKFDEIKESVSAGWIGGALNALAGVIKTILEIKNLLLNLLAAAASAIEAIISDPIGFLSNLISGVKQGFIDFGNNIKKHMIKGLIEWLTGSLGNVGITMPDNLFSLSGIFSLVSQMLGLTWDYFREKAVKYLGEPIVAGMEKAVEIFTIVKTEGVMGLWEYIKEQFSNLKEMVMDAIRDMVITKIIEAGIKWIMGLLSPAGAFVKAAMLIVDIVKFFVERAAQIIELVGAFVNGIAALAAGNVKAVSKAIETALAKALPVVISFLAALVGITGLTGKIQKIIKKVRKKIDKAIKKIIFKAKKLFKKKKGKDTKKGAKKKLEKARNEITRQSKNGLPKKKLIEVIKKTTKKDKIKYSFTKQGKGYKLDLKINPSLSKLFNAESDDVDGIKAILKEYNINSDKAQAKIREIKGQYDDAIAWREAVEAAGGSKEYVKSLAEEGSLPEKQEKTSHATGYERQDSINEGLEEKYDNPNLGIVHVPGDTGAGIDSTLIDVNSSTVTAIEIKNVESFEAMGQKSKKNSKRTPEGKKVVPLDAKKGSQPQVLRHIEKPKTTRARRARAKKIVSDGVLKKDGRIFENKLSAITENLRTNLKATVDKLKKTETSLTQEISNTEPEQRSELMKAKQNVTQSIQIINDILTGVGGKLQLIIGLKEGQSPSEGQRQLSEYLIKAGIEKLKDEQEENSTAIESSFKQMDNKGEIVEPK